MRLLEVKQKLDSLLNGTIIQVEIEQKFSGYAQTILKSETLFTVLEFLSHQDWNDADFSPIQAIIDKYNALKNTQIVIEQGEYQQLTSYVNELNNKLPIFIGIIDSITEEQSPEDINIKLGQSIDTPEKLATLVEQITDLKKFSNIDGNSLKFSGFDKGTDWIVVSASTSLGYAFIMACLKLAQQYLKTKEQYHKTEEAKLNYQAALRGQKDQKYTDAGFEKYMEDYNAILLENGAKEIADSISSSNGHAGSEIEQKATKTTESLINIIGDGNEVHLSLSTPKEITETTTGLVKMDYSYLTDLNKKVETKQIESSTNSVEEAEK